MTAVVAAVRGRLRRRLGDDEGSAIVEATWLAVLVIVPLVYVLLGVFAVQRAAFAASAAAREAGRAYTTAPDDATGRARAQAAVRLALADHGVDAPVVIDLDDAGVIRERAGLAPLRGLRVRVRISVSLPGIGAVLDSDQRGRVPVSAEHTAVVEPYRSRG